LKHFEYFSAHSAEEAVALLQKYSPDALPIAGGTELLVRMKQNLIHPKVLVDITHVPEFQGIALTEGGLRIGSLVTHAEVAASPLVRQFAPAVAAASGSVGAVQTRNLGTLGGNLVSCVPSIDSAPALLVLEAQAVVFGVNGRRQFPLTELFVGPRCSSLTPAELLEAVIIPRHNLGKPTCFSKFGRRKALTIALVNAAACVETNPERAHFSQVRLALGAVAPTPIRAYTAEAYLAGKPIAQEVLLEAGRLAAEDAKPIDDFRASAEYRRHLIGVLTRRVIEGALAGMPKV